jgi:hypothetical protein
MSGVVVVVVVVAVGARAVVVAVSVEQPPPLATSLPWVSQDDPFHQQHR